MPEIFSYYLQAGRVDVGFLGAAQIDRYGNLNSTVIGPYATPSTRLPGAGGAPEIAAHARQTFVMLKATPRSFVPRLDFRTSAGFLDGHGARARSGARGGGPRAVITDFGILTPAAGSEELELSALFEGATTDSARAAVGWPLLVAPTVTTLAATERHGTRDVARAAVAHSRGASPTRSSARLTGGFRDQESTLKNQHIRTELPGPKARAMIERDALVVSPSYPRDYPFAMSHGRGTEVWDVDGNRFLDFAAGIAVCATGHSHPEVVAAVQRSAEKFLHISSDYWHENFVGLAERLAAVAPMGEPVMSFLCQSGTESVEGALKLARYVTGRPRFIGFLGGFHGRTMGSLSFTSSKYTQQKGFAPTMPGVTHVPYPNPYRPLFAGADQGKAVLDYIRMLFERNVPPTEVAAILVEPIQGEGGYLVPPDGFLAGLRALCDEHGILLICDEVQSGIGRTGRMFAVEHWDVRPDIVTSAKGLGSGLPIGAVIAKRSIMEQWKRGAHGNTYGGNPVTCAAAIATLDLVQREYMAQCRARRPALHGAPAANWRATIRASAKCAARD